MVACVGKATGFFLLLAALVACGSGDEGGNPNGRGNPGLGVGGGGGAGSGVSAGSGASGTFGEQPVQPTAGAGTGGAAGSGGAGGAPEECAAITETAEVMLGAVDIVWVVDGSGSMLDEIAAVQQNITNFAGVIAAAGVDHHVVMLATTDIGGPT